MRIFKIYSVTNLQIYITVLILITNLCIGYPELTGLTIESLYPWPAASPHSSPYHILRNKSKLLTRFSRTWLCLVLIAFFLYLTPSHPQIYQAHSHPSTSILKAHIFLEHPYSVLCIASTLRILWVSPLSSPPWRCFPEHPIENNAFLLSYYLLILNVILN